MSQVIIIGAGHAGGAAAYELRKAGHAGPITLIGSEPHLPYQRPPLSKAYLKGLSGAEDLYLRPAQWYGDNAVTLRLGQDVTAIDRAAKTVSVAGESLAYDHLILATGSRPRSLDFPGVLTLRGFEDADRLQTLLNPGAHLVVIGGGYIGLEAAAVARTLGAQVTVVEREARLLARTASLDIAAFYAAEHKRQGVELCFGRHVIQVGSDGRQVYLDNGTTLSADAVLVGIGAILNADLAFQAGLIVQDGVVVDDDAHTSDPAIFAIGDVAVRGIGARLVRLESVHNALEQAKLAAAAICGLPRPKCETPWFWSDQYDIKLQIAGLRMGEETRILRGDPATRAFAVFHMHGAHVAAVEAVNAPAEFMAAKLLIASQKPVDLHSLADTSVPMKIIMNAPTV